MLQRIILSLVLVLLWGNLAVAKESGPRVFAAGQVALSKGKYPEALKLLKRAVRLLPHWGHVHLEYARALRFTGGDPKKIEASLNKARSLLPRSNPRVPLLAGLFWEGMGQRAKAVKNYSEALRLGHPSSLACLRVSRIWLSMQEGSKAIPCLRRLLRRRLSLDETYALLARALAQNKQIKDASKYWILALSRQPNSLIVLQKVYLFFAQHAASRPRRGRRAWYRTLRGLERRLKRLLPKKRKRKMRMLRPSRR